MHSEYRDLEEEVCSITVSPDGKWIISGSSAGIIRIWDMKQENLLFTSTSNYHQAPVVAVSVTSDNRWLISASLDKTIKVWDLNSCTEIFTLTGHFDFVFNITITPDSKYLISGSKDTTIKIWDLQVEIENENSNLTYENNSSIHAIAITPDSKQAISASANNMLTVWDLENPNNFVNLTDKTNNNTVNIFIKITQFIIGLFIFSFPFLILSIIPTLSCTVSMDVMLNVGLLQSLPLFFLCLAPRILDFFLKFLIIIYLAYFLIKYSWMSVISIISLVKNHIPSYLVYYKRGRFHSVNLKLLLWEYLLFDDNIQDLTANSLAILPDSKIITFFEETHFLWNIITGNKLFIPKIIRIKNIFLQVFTSSRKKIETLIIITSVLMYIFLKLDLTIQIYLFTIVFFYILDKILSLKCITAINTSRNGKYLISAINNNNINIWEIKRRKKIASLKGHSDSVNTITVSHDNKYFVSGSKDKTIKFWNLKKRKQLFTLKGHSGSVNTVAITSDSKYLISGSDDTTIKVWDLEKRAEIFTLKCHSEAVNAVTVTLCGQRVISASSDKTLLVWNLETKKVIAKFTGESEIKCCAVASDGVTIIAGEASGRLHFLRLEGI